MPITSKTTPRQLIPAGLHVARCYAMTEIGTNEETIKGKKQDLYKVRISWELPNEMRVFDEAKGPQPISFHKEFTLSLGKKANLRKTLDAWRGKAFTEDEARVFDITKLVGAPCMLNIIHKTSESSGNQYDELASISPVPKEMGAVPKAVNKPTILAYDSWDEEIFKSLPEFVQDKIMSSKEYNKMRFPEEKQNSLQAVNSPDDDLPF